MSRRIKGRTRFPEKTVGGKAIESSVVPPCDGAVASDSLAAAGAHVSMAEARRRAEVQWRCLESFPADVWRALILENEVDLPRFGGQLVACISSPSLLLAAVVAGGLWKTRSVFQGVWEGAGWGDGGGSLPYPGRPPAGVMGVRGKRGRFPQGLYQPTSKHATPPWPVSRTRRGSDSREPNVAGEGCTSFRQTRTPHAEPLPGS